MKLLLTTSRPFSSLWNFSSFSLTSHPFHFIKNSSSLNVSSILLASNRTYSSNSLFSSKSNLFALQGPSFSPMTTYTSSLSSTPSINIGNQNHHPILLNLVRTMVKYGTEYQPSVIKRKRRWGFLSRINTKNGRKILLRRYTKGRKYLSH